MVKRLRRILRTVVVAPFALVAGVGLLLLLVVLVAIEQMFCADRPSSCPPRPEPWPEPPPPGQATRLSIAIGKMRPQDDPLTQRCTRAQPHDGPCNGLPCGSAFLALRDAHTAENLGVVPSVLPVEIRPDFPRLAYSDRQRDN